MKRTYKLLGAVIACVFLLVGVVSSYPAQADRRGSMIITDSDQYKLIDGSKWLVIGDSNSALQTDQIEGRSYTIFAPAMSKGKLFKEFSIATSGNRSDQQYSKLTRLLTDGHRPTMASIMVGTNDLSQGIPISTWQSNVKKIVNKLIEFNIEPVLMTLPPRSGPIRPISPNIVEDQWNAWLKNYAIENNLVFVDVWKTLADPNTREFRAGYFNATDGVHINGRGQMMVANEFIRVLRPYLRGVDPLSKQALFPDDNDPWNIIPQGVFQSGSTSGWKRYGRVGAVPDSYAPGGYALDLSATSADKLTMLATDKVLASNRFSPGDKMKIIFKSRILSSTQNYSGTGLKIIIREWNSSGYKDAESEYFGQNLITTEYLDHSWEWYVSPGTTGITLYWKFEPGPSSRRQIHAHLGSIGLYNLTDLRLK